MTVLLRKDFGAFVVDRRSEGYEPHHNKLQSVPCEDCWGWKVGVCLSWRCRFAFYRLEKKMTVLLRKDFGAFVVDRRNEGYEPQKKKNDLEGWIPPAKGQRKISAKERNQMEQAPEWMNGGLFGFSVL